MIKTTTRDTVTIEFMNETINKLNEELSAYKNQCEAYKHIEDENNELIHNLMRHIDSITAKLNKLQHEGDKVDRPKRFICRVRKIRKTVHS